MHIQPIPEILYSFCEGISELATTKEKTLQHEIDN